LGIKELSKKDFKNRFEMKKYITIIKGDLQNIHRDPTLLLLLWVPLLVWAMCFFGLQVLSSFYPIIRGFYYPIIIFFALLVGIFPGITLSFILLDEKDAQLLPVIKVTPVSLSGFLILRLLFMASLSFSFCLLLLMFNGVIHISMFQAVVIAFLSALNMPILALITSTVAKNKVEGMTYLKVANVVVFLPTVAFFITSPWEYVLGIFPTFWVFQTADHWQTNAVCVRDAGIGILVLAGFNFLVFRYCLRKLALL